MAISNHSKEGEGKNAWYRLRNIRRTENQVTRATTYADWVMRQAEQREQREKSTLPSLDKFTRLASQPAESQPGYKSWYSRAKNFIKGKFRHRG